MKTQIMKINKKSETTRKYKEREQHNKGNQRKLHINDYVMKENEQEGRNMKVDNLLCLMHL